MLPFLYQVLHKICPENLSRFLNSQIGLWEQLLDYPDTVSANLPGVAGNGSRPGKMVPYFKKDYLCILHETTLAFLPQETLCSSTSAVAQYILAGAIDLHYLAIEGKRT